MKIVKYFITQSWLLIAASFFFGLLIAVTNAGLSPRIIQNKINKRNELVMGLLTDAKNFVPVDSEIVIRSVDGKESNVEVFKAVAESGERVGWSFNAAGPGFADKIELVVAVDANFEKIAGFDVLSSNETPGFGDQIKYDYFRNQFKGAPAEALKLVSVGEPTEIDSQIVAISGATVSSEAVVEIVSNFVTQIKEQIQKKGILGDVK
ncbi:MAG: FMN-binding protein [Sedimentisphaerales bacterium]|nr:FMN-binding protein [Sedimentisphaerales bacterium]